MATDKEKLIASRLAAVAAKDDFVRQYVHGHRDLSAGIGLDTRGEAWALKVFVQNPAAARHLPPRYNGLAVEIEFTGAAVAL